MKLKIPILILLVSLLLVGVVDGATTLYLRDIPASGVVPNAKQSADTITDDFATANATYAAPADMLATAGSGTFSNSGTGTSTADLHYTHYGSWVSPALGAQTVEGTVTIGLSMLETNAKQNMFPRVKIYRWYANDTYASDLLVLTNSGTEVGTTASLVTYFSTTAITTTTILNGDRIVIEIEDSSDPTETAARAHALQYGGAAAGAYGSYVTFSDTLTYAEVAPVAAFSGTPTSGDAPLTVTFTDASTNTPTAWAWIFGDGDSTNSTTQNPIHTYSSAGTFNVSLYASNGGGGDAENKTGYITVTESPCGASAYGSWSASGDSWVSNNSLCTVRKWNATGAHTWNSSGNATYADLLLVAGGGGGASKRGSGGGAGGLIYASNTPISGAYTITVGTGGSGGTTVGNNAGNGTNTSWGTTLVAIGGGRGVGGGGAYTALNGISGGSASGGAYAGTGGTTTNSSQGNNGGGSYNAGVKYGAGGGGGAGVNGADGTAIGGGNGGNGVQNNITGTLTWYAGGGAGGTYYNDTGCLAIGGLGGGGNGGCHDAEYDPGLPGTDGLGGGGGGAQDGGQAAPGGKGGNGTVIIRYLTPGGTPSAPVASFTLNRNPTRIPNSITATDTSTNTPTSWAWSWGDGTANSTTQNPVHIYTTRGRFNIILTATNAGGSGVNNSNYVRVVGYENYY